ncbi:MAG: sugar nucleotide-binding protein [Alphaproteobacteria bacterium]|nr:sugar nucleotide-binding protein [Alphaproteobacteria bacterium]
MSHQVSSLEVDIKVLVVGSDGQIGSGLLSFLRSGRHAAHGTTRKRANVRATVFHFDLEQPWTDLPLSEFTHVVICAGVTSITACEDNPEACELINVTHTIALIDRCLESGCFVIFLSSNAVFDGTQPFNRYDDAPNPRSQYGAFKLAVETHLSKNSETRAAVLRATKVIGGDTPFLRRWREDARQGAEIIAYSNRLLAPVPLDMVLEAVLHLITKRKSGIFQIGGMDEISYLDHAREVFRDDPRALALIKPVEGPAPAPYENHHNSLAPRLPA